MVFQRWHTLALSKSQAEAVVNSKPLFVETLKSNQPKLRITISDSLGKAGFIEEALQLGQQTTIDFPNYLAAWDLVATIYETNNKRDLAIQARLKTVELDPLNEIFKSKLAQDQGSINK